MAKKPTEKQLYKLKNEWLGQFFEEVKPKEFYRAVFPEGSFERAGHFEDGKANGIITIVENDKAKNRIVFDDLSVIDEVKGAEFAVMSPVAYSGRNRTAANARWLYGIAIDLDGVEMPQLRDVFHQMNHDIIPKCTYCINSGHGLHLYYLLEKPVPLYKHLQDKLREFKYELIAKVWNRYTSTFTEREQVQYQGIFQGFRMVGTQSKLGKRYPVKAFETGERVTIEYLNGYLMDKSKAVTDFHYKSDLSLAEARKKYPEWYEKRIVQGERRERWHIKRDLYDWWLRKIKEGASVGHRYSCLCVLASYAVKCDIPEDELFTDAFSLLQFLDDMSDDEHKDLKERCNEQSREQGLHVPEKGKTFAGEAREETVAWSKDTYQLLKQAEQGKVKSYVQDIALAVLDCKETAISRQTFIRLMNERGYGVDWQDSHKYITYTDLAREQAGEKACKIRDNKLEKYYNMDFGKESMEHEFERNARTAEAEQSKRAASRVKPTEPDRAGKQSAQRSVGDVERELRGIDEAVKSRTSKGRAEQAERRRAEQEAHQRAEAERRATEEQQRIASRRYIGRDWEPER